jgi:hypothetical protein
MAMKFMNGRYTPKNPSKYKGNVNNVVYRSSWELKLMNYLDSNIYVTKWSSETVIVPYRSPKDDAIHRYFIDFYAEITSEDNTVRKILIEVKPKAQTMPPKEPKKKTKSFVQSCITYAVNQAKWESAKKFAEINNMEFVIMTEVELNIKK